MLANLLLAMLSAAGAPAGGYQPVTVAELARRPLAFDGRKVEVSGVADSEVERGGWLFNEIGDLCGKEHPVAIAADFTPVGPPNLFTRRGSFRGVFHAVRDNEPRSLPGVGKTGYLTNVSLVSWDGPFISACF